MGHNSSVVVPQRWVTAVGPLLARTGDDKSTIGLVMAEQLYRDDELRPIIRKIMNGSAPTNNERQLLPDLVAGSWEQVVAYFKGAE
jgi:hypothetical protein